MIDMLTVLMSFLIVVTAGAAIRYYRILRKAQREYEKAREAVEDIVLSYSRQLQREAEKIDATAFKVEALSSKVDGTLKKMEDVQKATQTMDARVSTALQDKDSMLSRLEEFGKNVREVINSQSNFAARISGLDEQVKQLSVIPEANVEAAIPFKRDKALAPLTETELSVLEMLASEGPKTAPEIKDRVKLSREHTARLMKKLYEGGYLERDTSKIPFKYTVKKEMEALLKKTESAAA